MILQILNHIDPHHELADILDPPTEPDYGMGILIYALVFGWIFGFGFLVAAIGNYRHGGCGFWLVFGMIFGPIALPVPFIIPVNKEKKRAREIKLQRLIDKGRHND